MTFKAILPAGSFGYANFTNSFRRIIPTGVAIMLAMVFAGNFAGTAFATDSTISLTLSGEVVLNLAAMDETGTFGTSSEQTISIVSDHYTGYTLSITGSDDNGQLVGANNSSNVFNSVTASTSESTFSASANTSYNNMWGFLPSKYNSADNSNYLPGPTTTATVLDTTSAANATANTYTLAVGARANNETAKDSYSNTFVITAVGNPSAYQVTYDANTTATVSGLPDTTTGTLSGSSFTVSSTKPTRTDGYEFAGWCAGTATADSTTCSGTIVSTSETYTFSSVDQTAVNSVTLYALWEVSCPAGYICYDKNGADGTTTMANQSASASSSVTLRASNFSYTGHGFIGWSTVDDPTIGTDTIYGPMEDITTPSTIGSEGLILYAVWLEKSSFYTMQTFTSSVCSSTLTAATYDSSSETISVTANTFIALKDERDDNVYTVARLTDGNCWMTENLRLDHNVSATAMASGSQGLGGDFTKLADPETTFSGTTANSLYSTGNAFTMPRYSNTNIVNTSTSATSSTDNYAYGNYYTWAAAMATTTAYSSSSSDSAGTSICPTNWRLPMGSSSNGTTSGSFGYLSSSMGGLTSTMSSSTTPTGATMSARLRSFPNNFLYSGRRYSSSLDYRGSTGYYWSSTAYYSSYAYYLRFDSSYVYPGTDNYNKYNGLTVRCLAGS